MQTRFTEKYSNIITGIIDSPDPRIQHALTQQMHTNCLRNATTEELTIALRANGQYVETFLDTPRYGNRIVNEAGVVNSGTMLGVWMIAHHIHIQRTPLPAPQQHNASTAAHSR
jgi:hypothetical protein